MGRKAIRSSGSFYVVVSIFLTALASRLAFGDYDGRLPIGKGQPLARFGDSPPLYSTLFADINGVEAVVYWDPLLDTPRYVSMCSRLSLIEPSRIDDANLIVACRAFMDRNRDFFGAGSQDLIDPAAIRIDRSWLIVFKEAAGGVPIRGANIRILLTSDGVLESVKAFLLRDPSTQGFSFAGPEPIQGLLSRWNVAIESTERQLYFPVYDPASLSPVWCARGVDAESQPWEYFFDPETCELREQRRVVFELGEIIGKVTGIYPDPTDLYAAANTLKVNNDLEYITHPIAGARVGEVGGSKIASVMSDDDGNFTIHLLGGEGTSSVLDCTIEYGRPGDELPQNTFSVPWNDGYNQLLDLTVNLNYNDCNYRGMKMYLKSESPVKEGSSYTFVFQEKDLVYDYLVNSLGIMSFHHVRKFIDDAFGRFKTYNIPFHPFFPIRLVMKGTSTHRMEYLPSQLVSHICYSAVLDADDGYREHVQWVTPTMINHEYAHHLVYILTFASQSELYDCKNPDDVMKCVERDENPIVVREGDVIEGIADALAAYKEGLPRFGYYEPEYRGWMGYDISDIGQGYLPRDRAEVAKALWDLYTSFIRVDPEKGEQIAINLIYRWLGRNNSTTANNRIFDGSQVLMEEILDALDSDEFTKYSDNNRETVSKFDEAVMGAFTGRKFFYGMFIRGDADQNLTLNINDPIFILTYLFVGGIEGKCTDAMDVDGDNSISITDPVYFLNFSYLGGEQPPYPYPSCDVDPNILDDQFSCWDPTCEKN